MADRKFETVELEVDGKETQYKIYEPTPADYDEATKEQNRVFSMGLESKAPLRAQLDDIMKERKMWNDEKQAHYTEVAQGIVDGEKKIKNGGFDLLEAKELAMSVQELRAELLNAHAVKSQLDNSTVEGQADNAKFEYLVSTCSFQVDKDKETKVFRDYQDYLMRKNEKVASKLAEKFANIYYHFDPESFSKTPENEFLRSYGFMDEFGNMLKDGVAVDRDGKPFEDEKEVEFKPFVMADGSEAQKIVADEKDEVEAETEEPKKKTRKSRTKKVENVEVSKTD